MADLLPPNATAMERGFDGAAAARVTGLAVEIPLTWRPDDCPAAWLDVLASELSVDRYDPAWPEARRRAVIKASVAVHRAKGTRAAIRLALEATDWTVVDIVEGVDELRYDGSRRYDGSAVHGAPRDPQERPVLTYDGRHRYDGSAIYGAPPLWATYRVILAEALDRDAVEEIGAILASVAPARCELVDVLRRVPAFTYDGSTLYDGSAVYGGDRSYGAPD
ncbi:MAG: phage tail protein I [Pseudomonadota bacterium]